MMYYILIAIFLLLYSYLACKNIKTGIYLIVLFLPSYLIRFKVGPIPFTLLEGMILILFFCWLVKLYRKGGKINFNLLKPSENNPLPQIFRWPIILFLVAATISVFMSVNQIAALGIWKAYFIEPLLFFIVFIYNIKDQKDLKNVIYCLEILVIAIGLFAVIQKITGALIPIDFWAKAATRRVTTFFGYPNANGLLIAPIILLAIGNLLTNKNLKSFILSSLTIMLGILTIIFAQSTGALGGVICGLLFLLFYYNRTRKITLIAIIIFLIVILLSPFSSFKQKINYQKLDLNSTSLEIRLNQWSETLKMLRDNPILGVGLANYQNKFKPYHQFEFIEIFLYPHNIFLNFWSEIGLLGLMAFIWLIVVFFVYGFKKLKESASPILLLTIIGAMITLLIHGLVDVPYFKNDLAILFWVIIGLIIVNNNKISINKT